MSYLLLLLTTVCIYAILVLTLNLLVGYSGIHSFAHGAFFGIAAYMCTLAMLKLGLPFWLVQFYVPGGGVRTAPAWQAVLLLTDVVVLLLLFLNASRARRNDGVKNDPAGRALLWSAGAAIGFCVLALVQQQLFSDWNVVLSAGRYTVAAAPASALLLAAPASTRPSGWPVPNFSGSFENFFDIA